MAKVPRDVSGERLVRAFRKIGYALDHTVGSHAVLLHQTDPRKRLVVPLHRLVKVGTLSKLIKDAGLTVEQFVDML
ncbi:MAG: type II toxin-antitoxin system HicA family toxin [Terriglobia bacterium]